MYRRSYLCDYLADDKIREDLEIVCTPLDKAKADDIVAVCLSHITTQKYPQITSGNVALIKISHGLMRIPLHEVVLHYTPEQAKHIAHIIRAQEFTDAKNTQGMIRQMQTQEGQTFISVLTPQASVLISEDRNWENKNLSQEQIFQHSAIGLRPFTTGHDMLAQLQRSSDEDSLASHVAPLLQDDQSIFPQTLAP